MNILSFMWISVLSGSTEVKNEGLTVVQQLPVLCTVKEGTIFTKSLWICLDASMSDVVCAAKGGLPLERFFNSVFLYFYIQIWLCSLSYMESRSLLHAFVSLADYFVWPCISSIMKAKRSSDLSSSQLWGKPDLLEKEMKCLVFASAFCYQFSIPPYCTLPM